MDSTPEDSRRAPGLRRGLLIGGVLAVVAGLVSGGLLLVFGRQVEGPAPAAEGGLVVETGPRGDSRLASGTRLRCYVEGRIVGDLTLEDCARRNGVASGALDVGIDSSGALGAGAAQLTPLPPPAGPAPVETLKPPETPPAREPVARATTAGASPTAACWRHSGSEWRRLPGELTQGACVQTLFAGECQRPGGASYGRWGGQTLRLVPGRVEVSGDNRTFKPLLEQGPNCSLPAQP